MSTAHEVAIKHNAGIRLLAPHYWGFVQYVHKLTDYLPYMLDHDLPRVNADADPPPADSK